MLIKYPRALIAILTVFMLGASAQEAFAGFSIGKNGPQVHGFVESAYGQKLVSDQTKRDNFNLNEQRLQLKTKMYPEWTPILADWMATFEAKADFTVDWYYNGRTDADLRVLSLALSPTDVTEIKLGRQVFTWGTGDYLFINDVFPKDYESFYIGRDDEYLKKPNDGIKESFYNEAANIDLIVIPQFVANTLPDGKRLSFFDPFQHGIAGIQSDRALIEPGHSLEHAEFASRVYRNYGSYEAAGYMFHGHYRLPRGYLDEMKRELFYPRLDVYGASLRGPGFGGIVNAEFGFYRSPQDNNGDNRLIENSSVKYMMGYDKDLGNDLRLGVQYLYEQTLDYDNYLDALLPQDYVWDECRHVTTLRITKLYKNQTVRAGLFVFYSPSDHDGYLRPTIDYDLSDAWKLSCGANLAWGKDTHTEFGQMEHNKNIYVRVRYSY